MFILEYDSLPNTFCLPKPDNSLKLSYLPTLSFGFSDLNRDLYSITELITVDLFDEDGLLKFWSYGLDNEVIKT